MAQKKRLCGQCSNATKYQIETSKLKPYWISKIIDKNSLKDVENILKNNTYVELKKYTENGINIGEHSISGTLRFLAKGNIDPESINDLKIFKKYFKATYIFSTEVLKNFLNELNLTLLFFITEYTLLTELWEI